jgi:ketosteroid isomerase-like protein
MSQEYIKTVESFYQALACRDFASVLAMLDPGMEFYAAEKFIYAAGSPYIGPEAFRDGILARIESEWDGFAVLPEEILGAAEVVIARGRYRGKFRTTGIFIDAEFVHVFRFKEGRILALQSYTDTAQFRDAVDQVRSAAP